MVTFVYCHVDCLVDCLVSRAILRYKIGIILITLRKYLATVITKCPHKAMTTGYTKNYIKSSSSMVQKFIHTSASRGTKNCIAWFLKRS